MIDLLLVAVIILLTLHVADLRRQIEALDRDLYHLEHTAIWDG